MPLARRSTRVKSKLRVRLVYRKNYGPKGISSGILGKSKYRKITYFSFFLLICIFKIEWTKLSAGRRTGKKEKKQKTRVDSLY